MFRTAAQSTSPQANKSRTKSTQTTAGARSCSCCYTSIPCNSIKFLYSHSEVLFWGGGNFKLESFWYSHSGGYEEFHLLAYNAIKSSDFRQTTRHHIPENRTLCLAPISFNLSSLTTQCFDLVVLSTNDPRLNLFITVWTDFSIWNCNILKFILE
jgi:hypothetical protein